MLQLSESAAQKFLNEGNRYYDRNLFEEAIPLYLKELDKGKSYSAKNEAREKLANCYRLTGRFLEANEIYKKIVYVSNRTNKSENVLNYANSLKSSALYEEAAEQFKEYIKREPDDPMGPIYLESCYMAQEWLDEADEYLVMNHEMFNTAESDFGATYYEDGIVITSSREGGMRRFINLSDNTGTTATDLYYINLLTIHGDQPEITNMEQLNSFTHDGVATFSRNGKEVYFTRTIMGKKDRKTNMILNSLQVFYSQKNQAGVWTEPVSAFNFNSAKYSIGQPSLSSDERTIFFISDMPGGFGKTDIYYAEKQRNGSWGEPINAGKEINTFGVELFPFIHGNDTLFFSSDTHPGMGKLDIFYSVKKDGKWGKVKNMKTPVNSIGADFGIVLTPNGNRGFFSSDRFNGYGKEDIYTLYREEPLEFELTGNKIRFPDHTIYNGLSFKISREGETNSHDLEYDNGFFSFELEEDSLYRLGIRKNRFSYDAIKLKITRDSIEEMYTAELQSRISPMVVSGVLSEPRTVIKRNTVFEDRKKKVPVEQIDTITENIPVPSAEVFLSEEDVKINKAITDKEGNYDFPDVLQSGTKYLLTATRMELPEETDQSEELLAENQDQVNECEDMPAEKEDLPTEIEDPLTGNEEPSTENHEVPAEGEKTSTDTADLLAESEDLLTENEDLTNANEDFTAESAVENEVNKPGEEEDATEYNAVQAKEDPVEPEQAYVTQAEQSATNGTTTKSLEDPTYIPEEYLNQADQSAANTTTTAATPGDQQNAQEAPKAAKEESYMNLTGTVLSEEDKKAISDVKIKVYSEDILESEGATDTRGEFDLAVPVRERYDVDMNKEGYFHKQVQLTKEEAARPEALQGVTMPPIEKNRTMELRNILFDLDKSSIRPESYRELNRLADFMKENPGVIVQLNAHTDTRGNFYYNIQLSQKRAASVKRYLQQQGIAETRLIAQGFGESFPVVPAAVREDDHLRNRRVEFSVTDRHGNKQWYFSADKPVHTKGFIISDENIYSEKRPFTKDAVLPKGLFYRIKIVELGGPVQYNAFKGLFPVVQQFNQHNKCYGYYAGLFTSLDDAETGLEIIKRNFLDAEIEAFYNNRKIKVSESLALAGNPTVGETAGHAGQEFFYAIQIGAFKRSLNPSQEREMKAVAPMLDLITLEDKSNVVYALGSFRSYEEAFNAKKTYAVGDAISGAYVIAVLNGKKISIREAKNIAQR